MKNCLIQIPVSDLLRTALWAALGMACFAAALGTSSAWAQSGCVIINGTRACPIGPDPGGGGGGSPGNSGNRRQSSNDDAELTARNAIIDRYNAKIGESDAALNAGRYREAARLRREAVRLHEPLGENDRSRQALVNAERFERYADAADAASAGDAAAKAGNHALALEYYRTMIRDPAFDNESNRKIIADVKARLQAEQDRIKRETEAADLERRHRPEVERLRAEAKAMMNQRPADALAKLGAALKLLPGDSKTTGDWWLANASLALREARYDEAIGAAQSAQNFAGDSPEVSKLRTRIAEERGRQGANVQIAFNDLRQRLAAASSADTVGDAFGTKKSNPTLTPAEARKIGSNTSAGNQAKSVERHSSDAKSLRNDADKATAGMGFDDTGQQSGKLVYPDKKQQQIPPSALDKKIPRGAQDDPQIKEMQAWYRKLDAEKAEKEKMIAEIKEQQKTNKDPVLDVKIATLDNDVKMITGNQNKVTETVKARVEVVKKEMLNKGLKWDESPLPTTTETQESVKAPESSKLDFIRN